jgi:hypothetical protein
LKNASDEQLSKWPKQVEREFAANDNAAVNPPDAQPSHPDKPSTAAPSFSGGCSASPV